MRIRQAPQADIQDNELLRYLSDFSNRPLFILGEALEKLRAFPSESVDFCMTSPPYWGHRDYAVAGIGLEPDYREYITSLAKVFGELKRVLKSTGSFWLNL